MEDQIFEEVIGQELEKNKDEGTDQDPEHNASTKASAPMRVREVFVSETAGSKEPRCGVGCLGLICCEECGIFIAR
jgi:hypothetical protein